MMLLQKDRTLYNNIDEKVPAVLEKAQLDLNCGSWGNQTTFGVPQMLSSLCDRTMALVLVVITRGSRVVLRFSLNAFFI